MSVEPTSERSFRGLLTGVRRARRALLQERDADSLVQRVADALADPECGAAACVVCTGGAYPPRPALAGDWTQRGAAERVLKAGVLPGCISKALSSEHKRWHTESCSVCPGCMSAGCSDGLEDALALPVAAAGRRWGVLVLTAREMPLVDAQIEEALEELGEELALALQRLESDRAWRWIELAYRPEDHMHERAMAAAESAPETRH